MKAFIPSLLTNLRLREALHDDHSGSVRYPAYRLADRGALVYDVRPRSSHHAERIVGAGSLPLGEIEARMRELPSDRPRVFY